jgi:hypothetical protein
MDLNLPYVLVFVFKRVAVIWAAEHLLLSEHLIDLLIFLCTPRSRVSGAHNP